MTRHAVTAAAALCAGRLLTASVMHAEGWQDPYHAAYLVPPVWTDETTGEYDVGHMPGYYLFLRGMSLLGADVYAVAPVVQTLTQLAALAWLCVACLRLARGPWAARGAVALAFALGLDPWLTETALVMLPASLSTSVFVLLVERALTYGARAVTGAPVGAAKAGLTSGALCGLAAWFRAEFATYLVLIPVFLCFCSLRSGTGWLASASYLVRSGVVAAAVSFAGILPWGLYNYAASGTFTPTTNTGGGALWYGLGEIANPWGVPNPETGDDPIEEIARQRGLGRAFASRSAAAYFRRQFKEHVSNDPSFLLRLWGTRAARTLVGTPPRKLTFEDGYDARPVWAAVASRRDAGESVGSILRDADVGPWYVAWQASRVWGTALILTAVGTTVVGALARNPARALMALPGLAYATAVAVFVGVHWSHRYGHAFYWLGYLALWLAIAAASVPAVRRAGGRIDMTSGDRSP